MRENLPRGSRKLCNAWAFYDLANSVYSLTIVSAIFPIFYGTLFNMAGKEYIDLWGMTIKNTAIITFITAIAFLLVAVTSPLLSGIADFIGNKKSFMKFFCYLGGISCIGLYWFSLENIYIGLLFYFLGVIGFWSSIVFYNSYLPDIAFPDQYDDTSAKGFIMGYIGSIFLLIFNLSMIMYPDFFGIGGGDVEAKIKAMKISFVTVGIWWMLFSQYSFYYLPHHLGEKNKMKTNVIFNGYNELLKVWKKLKETEALKRYLLAFFVFSMGVQTLILVAAYFGEQEIHWKDDDERTIGLIVSILLIQLLAALGAKLTAKSSRKFGNIPTLIVINGTWLAICIIAYFIYSPMQFYIAAILVGLVMGGVQSLARSTYSKFLPETRDTTSFFSFYDVAEKIGIVIGMGIYGAIDQITGSMRNSALFLVVFFGLGIYLLFRVRQAQKSNIEE